MFLCVITIILKLFLLSTFMLRINLCFPKSLMSKQKAKLMKFCMENQSQKKKRNFLEILALPLCWLSIVWIHKNLKSKKKQRKWMRLTNMTLVTLLQIFQKQKHFHNPQISKLLRRNCIVRLIIQKQIQCQSLMYLVQHMLELNIKSMIITHQV